MITKFRSPFFDVFEKMFEPEVNFKLPKVKLEKDENGYKLLMSVPGLCKEDLKITVKNGLLEIAFEKEEGSLFIDRFTKTYTLPEDVDLNKIEGKVENGVLTLTLPYEKKKRLERQISLN